MDMKHTALKMRLRNSGSSSNWGCLKKRPKKGLLLSTEIYLYREASYRTLGSLQIFRDISKTKSPDGMR